MAQEVVVTDEPDELPIEGNRIILDATAGKEKIQIIDQANNQIVMNAVTDSEYIKLLSPKHDSYIILGDVKKSKEDKGKYADYGIYVHSNADYKIDAENSYWKHIKGHSTTTCLGAYSTFVFGSYTTIVGGLYTSIAPAKIDMCIGAKFEYFAGAKCVIEAGVKAQIGKLDTVYFNAGDTVKTCLKKIEELATEIKSLAGQTKIEALVKIELKAPLINVGCGALKILFP